MNDQNSKELHEAAQERVTNSYEVKYMVGMLLEAKVNQHLTSIGIVLGLMKVAAQYAGVTDERNRDQFLAMAAEISELDPEALCGCGECVLARAAARERIEKNWNVRVPSEFPATMGNA